MAVRLHTHTHTRSHNKLNLFQHYAMLLFQLNVFTLSQLNVLKLIELIHYGWAQLNLILSVILKRLPDTFQVFKFIIFIHPI